MVLNIDLAPTLLDLAGVAAPKAMQGASWKPLLAGQPAPAWRQSFFAEYFLEAGYSQIPTVYAVRTPTAKLIKYPGHEEWTELFDLAKDPYEINNLVKDPASKDLLAKMSAEFERAAKAVDFRVPSYADNPEDAIRNDAAKKKGKKKKV
jgi:arylsulfatase A-like enzyme